MSARGWCALMMAVANCIVACAIDWHAGSLSFAVFGFAYLAGTETRDRR